MDSQTLDTIARTVSASMTRRSALRGLFAAGVATVAGGVPAAQRGCLRQAAQERQEGRKGQTPTTPTTQGLPPGIALPDLLPVHGHLHL